MNIDIEKLEGLIENADEVFCNREAENLLLEFYRIKAQVEEAEKRIKKKLEETALKHSPHFKSLSGEKLTIRYQYMGSKYAIDEKALTHLPKNLYKTTTRYSPDSKTIEEYVEHNGALPTGITENEREKKILISIKNRT